MDEWEWSTYGKRFTTLCPSRIQAPPKHLIEMFDRWCQMQSHPAEMHVDASSVSHIAIEARRFLVTELNKRSPLIQVMHVRGLSGRVMCAAIELFARERMLFPVVVAKPRMRRRE